MKLPLWAYGIVALFIVAAIGVLWWRWPRPIPMEAWALYERECVLCHGIDGRGNGMAAAYLSSRPRNFTKGWFKIRSTPDGQLPTDADLLATLERGLPGTPMPSFSRLSENERRLLIAVVKGFYPGFATQQPSKGVTPPPPLPYTSQTLARGKELYRVMQCGQCHGERGHGDGLMADFLTDDWRNPIRPNNFSQGLFKGGNRDEDIYLRILTGLNGTPMPSYAGRLSDEDIYALVQYIRSFAPSEETH